jgi:small subunit ribosomal protein S24e
MLANHLNLEKKVIIPISMVSKTGKTDVHATFYIYDNEEEAKKHLPRYRLLRNMTKLDRKKQIDEDKAAKLKTKQAQAVESKTHTNVR